MSERKINKAIEAYAFALDGHRFEIKRIENMELVGECCHGDIQRFSPTQILFKAFHVA